MCAELEQQALTFLMCDTSKLPWKGFDEEDYDLAMRKTKFTSNVRNVHSFYMLQMYERNYMFISVGKLIFPI